MRQCLKIIVMGKVQDVGFRHYVQKEAEKLNVEGTVHNADNGSVHILACGNSEKLDDLIDIIYKGTSKAKVENVSTEPLTQVKDFRGVFRIIGFKV